MDSAQFGRISKRLAERRLSRRQAIRSGGFGLAAGVLATHGIIANAQDATPAPDISTAPPNADEIEQTDYLFVQSFKKGTLVEKRGDGPGGHTLTLDEGLGQTIFFANRPERIVGATATARFLEQLGFPDDNPPNAALVMEAGLDDTDFAVFELFNPRYDAATATATYDVHLLEEWEQTLGFSFSERQAAQHYLHPEFSTAHLFIDGCTDGTIICVKYPDIAGEWQNSPFCYDPGGLGCYPCVKPGTPIDFKGVQNYWDYYCNLVFADKCDGICYSTWTGSECDDC